MDEDDLQGTKEGLKAGLLPATVKIGNLRHTIEKDREGKLKTIIDHREALLKELFLMMQHSDDTDAIMQRSPNSLEIDEEQFQKFVQSYPLPINHHSLHDLSDASITSSKPPVAEDDRSVMDDILDDSSNVEGSRNLEDGLSERTLRPPPTRPVQRTKILTSTPRRMTSHGTSAVMCNKYPPSLRNKKERTTLDIYAWQLRVQDKLLMKTIRATHKAIVTEDWKAARREYKVMRALQRIDQLKMSNMWSFRQLRKSTAPLRTKTHWDHLLDEMRWMQTDFKEERKWKIAVACQISRWVMEWHEAENKNSVCIKRTLPRTQTDDAPLMVNDDNETAVKREPEEERLGIAEVFPDGHVSSDGDVKLERDSHEETIGYTQQRCSSADARLKRDIHFGIQTDDSGLVPANSELEISPLNNQFNMEEYHNESSFAHPSILFISPTTTSIKDEPLLKALFESYPIYEFSEPNDADPYIDNIETARITMVSKLTTKRNRVSLNGRLQRKKKPPPSIRVKLGPETYGDKELPEWLNSTELDAPSMLVVEPKLEMISPSLHETGILTLFSVPPEAKSKMFTAITLPDKPRYRMERPPAVWMEDEDEMLMYLSQVYQHNWEFIADCLNSRKSKYASPTHERRSAFDCYERWAKIEHTTSNLGGSSGASSRAGLNNAPGTSKSSRGKGTTQVGAPQKLYPGQRLKRSVAIIEAMKKVERRRDIANDRPPSNPVRKASIEPHANGNTTIEQIISPADLSHLKSEKDRQASQALLAQQQHHANHYALQGHLRPMIRPPMQGIPQYSQHGQSAIGNLPRSPSQPGRPAANGMSPGNGSPSKQNGIRPPPSKPTTTSQAQAAHAAALLQQQQAAGIALQQQQQASIAARLQQQAGGRQEQIQQILAARGLVRPGVPTTGNSTAGYQSPVQTSTNNQIAVPHSISTSLSNESLATAAASMQQTPAGAQARMVHAQHMANQYHVQRLQLLQQQQLAAAAQAAANQDPQAQQLALQAAKNAQNAMANLVARGNTPLTVGGQPVTPELLAALEKRRAEELSKARSQLAAGTTLPGPIANSSAVAQAIARQKSHSPLIQTTSSQLVDSSVIARSSTGSPTASPTPQQLAVARAAQAVAAASAAAAMRSPNFQNQAVAITTPAKSPNPGAAPSNPSRLSSSSPSLSSTTLPITSATALPSTETSPALPTTYLPGTKGHNAILQAQRGRK